MNNTNQIIKQEDIEKKIVNYCNRCNLLPEDQHYFLDLFDQAITQAVEEERERIVKIALKRKRELDKEPTYSSHSAVSVGSAINEIDLILDKLTK